MTRAAPSGNQLTNTSARLVLGMLARGDREHDIAAWFGVNQARVNDVKRGDFGGISAAPEVDLPPSGPPGLKGQRLLASVEKACVLLAINDPAKAAEATAMLAKARERFNKNQ
jgi:hypothetical protein